MKVINTILHITNWYPNKWDDLEGIFVKEQYKVFSEVTDSHLINVQVRNGVGLFKYQHINYSDNEEGYYILTKIKSNKIIEILTTLLLLVALYKSNYKKYDLLHFHIAYPLLIHYFIWKKIIKLPVIISEHWSAYHFNFYLPDTTKKLDAIRNIFRQKIPVITVSASLLKDIHEFSKTEKFLSAVIPNIVDKKYFHFNEIKILPKKPGFFIVNIWRSIKNPFPMLEAFAKLASKGIDFELRIGGYGDLLEDMKMFVNQNGLAQQVIFLGKMNKEQISNELSYFANAYIYSSKYETFSLACAQALACGCPLIGPAIPSIMEYSDENERIVVTQNDINSWEESLEYFMAHIDNYDHVKISQKAENYFSYEKVKNSYIEFLSAIEA